MSAGTPKLDRKQVVRVASGTALARLQLTAEEGFVLSRLDRPMSVEVLLSISGLPLARAESVVQQLVAKRAILRDGEADPATSKPPVATKAPSPYGDFIFSPAELNDAASLPIELRKEIVFLHAHLSKWSYWRLLGVKPGAPDDEVRRAFLEQSKKFHPDKFFRQDLGRFGPMLSAIFQQLRLAADTLADPVSRAKYEKEAKSILSAEEKAVLITAEVRKLEAEQRRVEQRERLLKARGFAKPTQARAELAQGDELLAKGDFKGATEHYRRAQDLDPRLELVKGRLAEAQRVAKAQRSELGVNEAMKAIEAGELDKARTLLKSAIEAEPGNERAHAQLAYLILRTAGDANEARMHAQKAVDLGDPAKETKHYLARALIALGRKKDARRVLESLNPNDPSTKALLKEC